MPTEGRDIVRRICVVLVDDNMLIREGFRKLLELEPDMEIVGTAGDGEAALAVVAHLHQLGTPPDVILMDIRMPLMDGIVATKMFNERWPNAHIVIFTMFEDAELIDAALRAGALDYSPKCVTAEQLARLVRAATRGQRLLQKDTIA